MSLLRFTFSFVAVLLFGCTSDIPKEIGSIFVEASPSASPSMRLEVRLPVSGIGITVMTAALVPAENILGTRIITSGDADLRQQFLLVQVNRKSAVDIMKYSKEAIGRHFVLVIDNGVSGQAVGLMPIDEQIVDGNLIFHVEKKGLSNAEAVADINKRLDISILKLRKLKQAEGL